MNKDALIEKLQKILALAERGVDGEAVSARNLLEQMMQKYGLSEDDLQANPVRILHYTVGRENSPVFHILALCVTLAVKCNIDTVYGHYFEYCDGNSQSVRATLEEHGAIAALFEFYTAGYERTLTKQKKIHAAEVSFLQDEIKALKKSLKGRQQELAYRRKEQAREKRCAFGAFAGKNNLFQFYWLGAEDSGSSKSKSRTSDDAFYAAWEASEKLDSPNMLPAMRLGKEDA